MNKQSKTIVFMDVRTPLNMAMRYYLKENYPGYDLIFTTPEDISEIKIKKLNPKLLVLPGHLNASCPDIMANFIAEARGYLANSGANLLAICSGVYFAISRHVNFGYFNQIENFTSQRGHSLDIFPGTTALWPKDLHNPDETRHQKVFTPDGRPHKILHLNSPRIGIYPEARQNTEAILQCTTKYGTPSDDAASMTVTRLPSGGRAVLSGAHFEVPFTDYIDACDAFVGHFRKKRDKKGVSRFQSDRNDAQAAYDKHFKYYEPAAQRLRDYVYEEMLGLKR
jgi:glutamine amidotransferase-like uncharacterized protein